jgi:hypothetical protein
MSEKGKGGNQVTLDLETNTHTSEGRIFIDTLQAVTRILARLKSEVTFEGKEIARVQWVSDNKSITIYECPNGYFLFFDKLIGKDNRAISAKTLEEALAKVPDEESRKALQEALEPATAEPSG